jgi:hypothetical protein
MAAGNGGGDDNDCGDSDYDDNYHDFSVCIITRECVCQWIPFCGVLHLDLCGHQYLKLYKFPWS